MSAYTSIRHIPAPPPDVYNDYLYYLLRTIVALSQHDGHASPQARPGASSPDGQGAVQC